MRMLILASTLASGVMFAATSQASALTVTPLPLAGGDAPAVTLVSGGCGPGFHRGFYGYCRPNFYRPYFYRPFGYYHRWGWGWHRWHRW